MSDSDFCMVLTTCSSLDEAEKISGQLVSAKLAACVQISSPIKSCYVWKDKVENSEEFRLVIKTKSSLIEPLEKELLKIHSYDTPQFLVIPNILASKAYGEWMTENLA